MGRKIDLDRLLEECNFLKSDDASFCGECKHQNTKESYFECIRKVAESLVEPEIDFDALRDEWAQKLLDHNETHEGAVISFRNFLKSKHLTAPKPKQLSVKKTGILKSPSDVLEGANHISFMNGTALRINDVGIGQRYELKLPEFCYKDIREEPDYSQVKVGDVVEIHHPFSNKPNYGIVQKNSDNMLSIVCNIHSINAFCISYSQIKSLTILKASE